MQLRDTNAPLKLILSSLSNIFSVVAPSAGTLCDPDGELFIKPATKQEVEFYESANAQHPDLADIMPVFMGTLQLNNHTDISSINEQLPVVSDVLSEHLKEEVVALAHQLHPALEGPAPGEESIAWRPNRNKKIATDIAIVLENSAYGFARPNIMDCKLGVRLWADDAPEEKKRRFDKISAETTHKELGFRVAGMRVYRGSERDEELDPEEYKKYDKDWGRFSVSTPTVVESMRKFLFNPRSGVSDEDAKFVAEAFCEELKKVEKRLAAEETRMYSASLLFVFEGDGPALKHAIKVNAEAAARKEARMTERQRLKDLARREAEAEAAAHKGRSPSNAAARVDSGIDVSGDNDVLTRKAAGALDDYDDEDDDDVSSDGSVETLEPVLQLRLIDFAHAAWVPGQGPDENVLKGVRSLITIFDEMSR
ncbi:inositol polyphosphate multikinase [Pyricularia oryzae Y34]|uniref:Kinase n=1 Tax=Pyricularia oryzae (strain Y34) TaxID=1143189 RepID=A0AA97PFH4_PYRO3|nr:inositol polyphosphate multikinase [Pyricularia oryzae Y34]